jgi:hypothetical protein
MVPKRKSGRPSDLTKFNRDFEFGPILPRKCDDLHDERWIGKIGSYLVRSAANEHDLQSRLSLKDDLSRLIDQRLEQIRYSNTMQYIAPSRGDTPAPKYPPIFVRGTTRDNSIAVGWALYAIARAYPELLRYVASGYAIAEQRMSIVLHRPEDAPFGRKLIRLVNHLGILWLGVRLSGFRVGAPYADLSEWQRLLRTDQVIGRIGGKNGNHTTTHHLRIDIIDTRTQHLSRAFHSAMLWAYLVELWRIPRRAKSSPAKAKPPRSASTQIDLFEDKNVRPA